MTFGVVIVDDASDLRFLLEQAIHRDGRLRVLASVGDGQAGLDAVERHRPDIVLMDVSMPVMDGLTATRCLRARHPELPVVIFTGFADDELAVSAQKAGGSAFLAKDRPLTEVIATLYDEAATR